MGGRVVSICKKKKIWNNSSATVLKDCVVLLSGMLKTTLAYCFIVETCLFNLCDLSFFQACYFCFGSVYILVHWIFKCKPYRVNVQCHSHVKTVHLIIVVNTCTSASTTFFVRAITVHSSEENTCIGVGVCKGVVGSTWAFVNLARFFFFQWWNIVAGLAKKYCEKISDRCTCAGQS